MDKINFELILSIAFALIIFVILVNVLNRIICKTFVRISEKTQELEAKKKLNTLKLVTVSAVDLILFALTAIHILSALGVDMKPVLATAGVLGLAVGFGAKRFVEDIISGLIILFSGQVRVGDFVQIQGVRGVVEKMDVTMIVLRSEDGAMHFIRNGLVDNVANYTREFSQILVNIGVAYKEDIASVIKILKEIGEEMRKDEICKHLILDPIEVFGLDEFADSAVIIKCRIKTLPMKQWEVKRAFNLRVKEKFDELGIEIPFPQVVVTKNQDN